MYLVMTKRSFNLNLRVSPELDSAFDSNARLVGQTKSNLLTMLMEAFNKAMGQHGQVVMPLQIKTPADCASASGIHNEHNGVGHQVLKVADRGASYSTEGKRHGRK